MRPAGYPNRLWIPIAALALAASAATAPAQNRTDSAYYARANSLGVFTAYSADSSHMLLGYAENRMLLDIGASYNRRLMLGRVVNWQYSGELLPVALESDPLGYFVNNQVTPTVTTTSGGLGYPPVLCSPQTSSYSYTIQNVNGSGNSVTYSGTETISCSGRQWTIGEALSPFGMQWNFLPRRKAQPIVAGHGGYMYSTRPIPVAAAGSFNFTFDLGAGVELYRSKTRSIRAEYRYHHVSNKGTADTNPGIDNGLFQVTYCFGFGRQRSQR